MILAIETASADTSIAIAEPDGEPIAVDGATGDARQNASLLPRVVALLDEHGRTLRDVGRVAVGIGPGSFTGLRVGMSLAKGLAHALGVPIVGVPSLEAWLASEPDAAGALSRAGAREAHLLARGENSATVVDEPKAVELSRSHRLVAPAELAAAFGLRASVPPLGAAVAMATMAAGAAANDLASLEPRYGRPPRGLDATPEGAVRWL